MSIILITISAIVLMVSSSMASEEALVLEPTHLKLNPVYLSFENTARFVLSNKSDKLLRLSLAESGCGCSSIKFDRDVILPHESINATVHHRAESGIGEFTNGFIIAFKDDAGSTYRTELKVSGKTEYLITTRQKAFVVEKSDQELLLEVKESFPFGRIVALEPRDKQITIRLLNDGEEYLSYALRFANDTGSANVPTAIGLTHL